MTTPSAMPGAARPYPQPPYGQPPQPPYGQLPDPAAGPYPQPPYGQPPQPPYGQLPDPAAGPYPQPPYGQPPQPPKKRRTWLIVLLVILPVMLIGLVSCGALIGTASKAINEDTTAASQSQPAEDERNSTPIPSAERDVDPYAKLRGEPGFVSRAHFGKRWPLTVEAGVVSCEPLGAKTHLGSVTFMDPDGKRYAVNGTATAHHPELPEIDEIWAPNPANPGARIDMSPVIYRGLELC
jgi:Protein of unknown function (DUF2511)